MRVIPCLPAACQFPSALNDPQELTAQCAAAVLVRPDRTQGADGDTGQAAIAAFDDRYLRPARAWVPLDDALGTNLHRRALGACLTAGRIYTR